LQTYPYTLFDKSIPYENPAWRPEVIVMFLGTNDFAMPLHDGERWTTREALQADFEAKYSAFVKDLRTRHPDALIVLWATTFGDGEIAAEVQKVAEQVKAGGDENLQFLLVKGLAFEGCNHHPSAADDRKIADALMELIDTRRARFSRR
jgi:lysophospholipase L1-like esterase